jgi:hypothetical protein
MICIDVPLSDMGKKRSDAAAFTQANFKFDPALMRRVRAFCNRHPMTPSMTRVFSIAVTRYLDAEEPNLPPEKKAKHP